MTHRFVSVMKEYSSILKFEDLTREYIVNDDPNYLFLNETLISEIRRRSRYEVTFFSARSWRKPLKPIQVAAMRNLKNRPDEAAVREIAREAASCASTITNGKPFDLVCSVPGGSSCKKENFASLIGRFVAEELNIGYREALATAEAGGTSSSHPKQSMHFRSRYTGGQLDGCFALLVDDTSPPPARISWIASGSSGATTSP